jgi:hypothetical protein
MQVREVTIRVIIAGDDLEAHDLAEWVEGLNESILSAGIIGDRTRDATAGELKTAEAYGLGDDE